MHLPYFIARRYLLGEKSRNAINYITAISIVVTALVTMALIVILSVFNGLSGLISSLYGNFDPPLKIVPVTGKFFDPQAVSDSLKSVPGNIAYTQVIEEDVLLKHDKKQFIGRIKGVSGEFHRTSAIDSLLIDGHIDFSNTEQPTAAVGQGLAYFLSVGLNFITPIHVYAPNPKAKVNTSPDKAFNHQYIFPSAIFSAQQDIDSKYIITDLLFASKVLGTNGKISAIEIGGISIKEAAKLQPQINKILPENLKVLNQEEQHEFLFKVMKSEKWAIFLIISFILIIASFNIVGSLSMLIIDKKKDIGILKSMGANIKLIKQIFIIEGWLITGSGIISGMLLGILLCLAQEYFGILKLQAGGNFIISAYPVDIQVGDILIVTATVSIIGFTAAFYPVSRISQKFIN